MTDLDRFYQVSHKLVREAGEVIKDAFKKAKKITTKCCDIDLVTETDQEVEKLLIQSLKKEFPDHKFIGEESTIPGVQHDFTNDPTWIIDPVDGTMNFVHTNPMVAISLALTIDKLPVIGIIYNPMLDLMYTAKKGQGAFLNGEKIKVSGQDDLSKALICSEVGTNRDAGRMRIVENNLLKLIPRCQGVRIYGSAACASGLVATGSVDAFCHIGLHIWDIAMAQIIVEEAGGVLTNYEGIRALGCAAMNIAMVAQGGTDGYFEIGIHAWDIAAGVLLVEESGGAAIDTSGGPLDLLNRRVIVASSMKLAKELSQLLEQFELERD